MAHNSAKQWFTRATSSKVGDVSSVGGKIRDICPEITPEANRPRAINKGPQLPDNYRAFSLADLGTIVAE
jgi:hypothetical protein